MRRICILLLIVSSTYFLQAQKYTTAAGVRLGSGIGLTLQQSLWKNYTLEGIVQKGFLNNTTTLSALLEQHHGILGKSTNFYLGAGPQIGMYGNSGKTAGINNSFGVAFIGGLEFKFGKTLLSFDYKPSINLSGGSSFIESGAAVSLRYVFIKAQPKEHKWMFWKKSGKDKKGKVQ